MLLWQFDLSRGTIVIRTHHVHKNLYVTLFLPQAPPVIVARLLQYQVHPREHLSNSKAHGAVCFYRPFRFDSNPTLNSQPFGAILGSSVLPELLPTVWPVSGVVASALLQTPVLRHFINYLGVRKAGTRSIHQMFADGYQVNL